MRQFSELLPQPPQWPEPSTRTLTVASLVFVGILGVAGIAVGFGFVAVGLPAGLRYSLVFSALMVLTAAFGYVTQVRLRHRDGTIVLVNRDGRRALELRGSTLLFVLLCALCACLTSLAGMASVDYFRAGADVPAKQIPAALCAVAAVYWGSMLVLVALGRVRRGRIVLSVGGISHRGWTFSSFLPWDSIIGATAAMVHGTPCVLVLASANAPWQRRQYARWWPIDRLPSHPEIAINCAAFAIDGTLLYHLIRFYRDNPAARAELGTQRSLQRARTGDLL